MKSPIYLIALIIAVAPHAGAEDKFPDVYPVRSIPVESEKFGRIWEEVAGAELAARRSVPAFTVTILQHLEADLYLARVENREIDWRAEDVAFRLPGRRLADGTRLMTHFTPSEETYAFLTVLGAKRTLQVVEEARLMTREEFAARLRGGEAFFVVRGTAEVRCELCRGAGSLIGEKRPCPRCKGDAVARLPRRIKIVW